jgi:hypothetical protein
MIEYSIYELIVHAAIGGEAIIIDDLGLALY